VLCFRYNVYISLCFLTLFCECGTRSVAAAVFLFSLVYGNSFTYTVYILKVRSLYSSHLQKAFFFLHWCIVISSTCGFLPPYFLICDWNHISNDVSTTQRIIVCLFCIMWPMPWVLLLWGKLFCRIAYESLVAFQVVF